MAERNYYEILGIERNATATAIKNTYRRLAKDSHPDKHPEDPDANTKFHQIQEAYNVLHENTTYERDQNERHYLREVYDLYGTNHRAGAEAVKDCKAQHTEDCT